MVEARSGQAPRAQEGSPAAAAEAARVLLGPLARRRELRLELALEGEIPEVALGADALRQVLLNLALNAIEASPPGACVRIGARPARGGVEISIEDEGRGLAGARSEESRMEAARPGGLGLAITRRLVEGADGVLEIRARRGGGAQARVRLPRRATEPAR